jgi:hypothetical protein
MFADRFSAGAIRQIRADVNKNPAAAARYFRRAPRRTIKVGITLRQFLPVGNIF